MPHLLLIDNDPSFCLTMLREAQGCGFELVYKHSLEEGMAVLAQDAAIDALILDTRCPLDKDDTGEGRTNFIPHALSRIQLFCLQNNKPIPYCFSADNPAAFSDTLHDFAPVFNKKTQTQDMLAYISKALKALPVSKIKEEHRELFAAFDAWFSYSDEALLTELLLQINKSDAASIISNLTMLRRLLEGLIILAGIKLLTLPKDQKGLKGQEKIHTREILRRIYNGGYISNYHFSFADRTYMVCSNYGSHPGHKADAAFFPGVDTVRAMFHVFSDMCCVLVKHF